MSRVFIIRAVNTSPGLQNVKRANRDYVPLCPSSLAKHAFQVRCESSVKVEMRASNLEDRTGISLTGGTLLPRKWGHVAFSIDALGHCKLIVNGAEVASGVFRGMLFHLSSGRCLQIKLTITTLSHPTASCVDLSRL